LAPATPQPQSQSEEQIVIASRPLGWPPAGEFRRGAILIALIVFIALPAGANITDVEPANDSVAAAPIQVIKTGTVTMDAGELVLVAGDIDFVGIAALSTGDVVTVTTTPLDDADLEVPDTTVGLFDSSTTDPTHMILCRGDDTANNDLITGPAGLEIGFGSLCRFGITAPGDYYVGVTGFRGEDPPGCDPAAGECSSFPFDGGIGPIPCEESGGGHGHLRELPGDHRDPHLAGAGCDLAAGLGWLWVGVAQEAARPKNAPVEPTLPPI
jgi:hypothetical protein